MRAAWMTVTAICGAGNAYRLCAPVNGLVGDGIASGASLYIHVLIHGQIV